jgi:hypothetical protein
VGKTTICRHIFANYTYINLEDIGSRNLAKSDPNYFLDSLGKYALIDEIQNCPELLSSIQVRVDQDKTHRYILTGSSNFSLLHTACQSLAGRAALFTLPPLTFSELGRERLQRPTDSLLLEGFYPGVNCDGIPFNIFYRSYYNTYVERDVRNLLRIQNLEKFDIFVRLLAGRAGSELNASSLAVEVGVSSVTISEWMSILEAAYIIFPLRPYFSNISKRLTKMPKIYFYDTGLAAYLLGIEEPTQLATHPLRGALFENMAVAELVKQRMNQAKDPNQSFYREYSGREVDLLIAQSDGLHAYEIKAAKTFKPEFTANMQYLASKLPGQIASTTIIYDGETMGAQVKNVRDI